MFRKLVVDGGLENKVNVKELTTRYGIKRVVASAYYLPRNSIIKRGYKLITDILAKMTDGRYRPWV
jgi:hypothetical protein